MRVYLKNNRVKFQPDPIWFKRLPQEEKEEQQQD